MEYAIFLKKYRRMVNSVCFIGKNTVASAAKAAGVSLREGD